MTIEIALLFLILFVMVVLFMTELVSIDLTALVGLLVLVLLNYIPFEEAFSGFSSPAVITTVAMFVIAAGLSVTGVADGLGGLLFKLFGSGVRKNILGITVVSGVLSAFMNNVAATVVMLPIAVALAARAGIAPSLILMPMAFGVLLGGTITVIGNTTNIVFAETLARSGLGHIPLFEFAPVGVPLLLIGVVTIVIFGPIFLPNRDPARGARRAVGDLTGLYRLFERIFAVRVPRGSSVVGLSLRDLNFRGTLGVQVVAIVRDGQRHLAPRADDRLQANDIILVQGRRKLLDQLLRFQGVETWPLTASDLPKLPEDLLVAKIAGESKALLGKEIGQTNFRDKHQVGVLCIERKGSKITRDLATLKIEKDDFVEVFGNAQAIRQLEADDEFLLLATRGAEALQELPTYAVRVQTGSPLRSLTLQEARIAELLQFHVVAVAHSDRSVIAIDGDERIQDGDTLFVVSEPRHVESLGKFAELRVEKINEQTALESGDIGVFEIIPTPRSRAIDKTIVELDFYERYGFQVLAVWRNGKPKRSFIATMPLQLGDALLVQGPRSRAHLLAADREFLLLSSEGRVPAKVSKQIFAVLGLAIAVFFSAFDFQPVHFATLLGAVFVIATGTLTMEDAYREISWRMVVLIGCLTPLVYAFESTGAAVLLSNLVVGAVEPFGPYALIFGLLLLSSGLSQMLDGIVAILLLVPIAAKIAPELGINPLPLLIAINFGTSLAFLTPFSARSNLLVLGAGGYKPKDYFKLGVVLTIVSTIAVVYLIPLVWKL